MSLMSRFLKQTAVISPCTLTQDGSAQLDKYGQPVYGTSYTASCRKEPYKVRGATGYGQYQNYSTTYYFDDHVALTKSDKIDDQEIQKISDYVDGRGKLIGYEVQV